MSGSKSTTNISSILPTTKTKMSNIDFTSFSNIIDGTARPTKASRHGINPATKEELWPAPLSTSDDVNLAVSVAKRAQKDWAKNALDQRRQAVLKFADAFASHTKQFAELLTSEQGKPLSAAENEVAQAVQMLQGMAKLELPDEVIEESSECRVIKRYIPIGVCVGIVPWNFPLLLAIFKLGPALIAGNALILKPSPFTPYSALKLVELAQAFFNPGVVQVLSGGDDLGPLLTEHPGVDKVSFTGSTATGIRVMQSCAKTLKRVTLELGGNDPAIVCSDVDIATVAPKIALLALYNSGQVCIAIKRIYVHASIYDAFVKEVAKFVESLVVGPGTDKNTVLGPVQNEMQYRKIQAVVNSIKDGGFKMLSGNLDKTFTDNKGFFVNPLIVDNPPDDSEIVTGEPFGPVFPIMKWEKESDVIARANDTDDALGASVWSQDTEQADRIARELRAGTVWINTHMELRPDAAFGGLKKSGIGYELGTEGLKSYCNMQTVNWHKGKM